MYPLRFTLNAHHRSSTCAAFAALTGKLTVTTTVCVTGTGILLLGEDGGCLRLAGLASKRPKIQADFFELQAHLSPKSRPKWLI